MAVASDALDHLNEAPRDALALRERREPAALKLISRGADLACKRHHFWGYFTLVVWILPRRHWRRWAGGEGPRRARPTPRVAGGGASVPRSLTRGIEPSVRNRTAGQHCLLQLHDCFRCSAWPSERRRRPYTPQNPPSLRVPRRSSLRWIYWSRYSATGRPGFDQLNAVPAWIVPRGCGCGTRWSVFSTPTTRFPLKAAVRSPAQSHASNPEGLMVEGRLFC